MTKMAFVPAQRASAKPLIGLYGESSSGKTFSALLLARGFVGPKGRIGMIETEAGRGEAYVGHAQIGHYDVCSMRETFSPQAYGEAISEAERQNFDALIIDSASHEWEGVGGVLDMADANRAANKQGVLVWQKPKMDHARFFMLRLMQTPIPLVIVNMRAKYPMIQRIGANGKQEWARGEKLEPKQSDDILYEMFLYGWIDRDHRYHGEKYTLDEYRAALKDGEPLTLDSGLRLRHIAQTQTAQAEAAPKATDEAAAMLAIAERVARQGTDNMTVWWTKQSTAVKSMLKDHRERLRSLASEADAAQAATQPSDDQPQSSIGDTL